MLQLHPVYSLWNRHKTLTGSPDPMHANGTNKPCTLYYLRSDTPQLSAVSSGRSSKMILTVLQELPTKMLNYRLQQSCKEYVFASVCLSTEGRVCLSACWDTTPRPGTPPGADTAPGTRHPLDQAPLQARHPPWTKHPLDQAPPGPGTPRTGHPPPGPGTTPFRPGTPPTRHPPGTRHPPDQAPPRRLLLRTVRILLNAFLFFFYNFTLVEKKPSVISFILRILQISELLLRFKFEVTRHAYPLKLFQYSFVDLVDSERNVPK